MKIAQLMTQNKNKIYEITNEFHKLNEVISTQSPDILETNQDLLKKLDVLHDNMDIIHDNIMDIYNDIQNKACIIPSNIKKYIEDRDNIENICKDLSPLILLYIINKNNVHSEINPQHLGDHAPPWDQ